MVTGLPSKVMVTVRIRIKIHACNIYRSTDWSEVGLSDNDRLIKGVTVNVFEAELDP